MIEALAVLMASRIESLLPHAQAGKKILAVNRTGGLAAVETGYSLRTM